MDAKKYKFIQAVLGEDGAKALAKAAERGPELEAALLPRTIMAWLGIVSRSDYEGDVPGVGNTYLQFTKSEDRYSGSISIGPSVYSFESATVYHLAASIAVALGADREQIHPGLRDLDLVRLGKNIDTLAKARVAVAELRKMRSEPLDLQKALRDIQPGKPVNGFPGDSRLDYSHVLSPILQRAGYSINVKSESQGRGYGYVRAQLRKGPLEVGLITADHREGDDGAGLPGRLRIGEAEIPDPQHHNKGLGKALYEAIMAHAVHHLGVQEVAGSTHSSMASRVHQSLANKHGFNYKPEPNPKYASEPSGPYDGKNRGYSYTVKAEPDPHGGAEAPGPQAAPRGPGAPNAPLAPQGKQTGKGPTVPLRPKLPKVAPPPSTIPQIGASQQQKRPDAPSLTVSKSQAQQKCGICGSQQFQGDRFVGCICFRELSRFAKAEKTPTGYRIEFGPSWDRDSLVTLAEALEEK